MKYLVDIDFHIIDPMEIDRRLLERLHEMFGEDNVEISVNGTGFGISRFIIKTDHDIKNYNFFPDKTLWKDIISVTTSKLD